MREECGGRGEVCEAGGDEGAMARGEREREGVYLRARGERGRWRKDELLRLNLL